MNLDGLELHNRLHSQSNTIALKLVEEMNLPVVISLSNGTFASLGTKVCGNAEKVVQQLIDVHGDNLQYLCGIALRESWFARCYNATYMALMIAVGEIKDDEINRTLVTPHGYGEAKGVAWTLYDSLSEVEECYERSTFRSGTPYLARPKLTDLLNCVAVYWLQLAADEQREGHAEGAFNWLHEAYVALSLVQSSDVSDEVEEEAVENITRNAQTVHAQARRSIALAASAGRHKETNAIKADVFKWLDSNFVSSNGIDKNAQAVLKQQPIAFTTARTYIKEWKKLQSASTL